MLPKTTDITENLTTTQQPSRTYRMLIADEKIVGQVEDIDAIAQACYKILNTERYQYVIYSWNYGVELQELFGKPMPYVYAEVPRRIREALMQDDRIEDVTDFELSHEKGQLLVKFSVVTVSGTIQLEKGVQIA